MTTLKNLCGAMAFACLVPPQFGHAGGKDGEFVIRGIGYQQCAYINQDYSQNNIKQMELASWISGYVTHTNKTTDAIVDWLPIGDTSQFAALVSILCKSQPSYQIQDVVAALGRHFEPYHVHNKGVFQVVKSESHQVAIRPETIEVVQGLLAAQGYLPKEDVDGEFGPKTSQAILKFQEKTGRIQKTGVPDILTLFALLDRNK
ncbi:peptidoglycan-binding domain-containing protein [Thalassovita sp.]|uniref:peptidoglycan-binding domain-containing protein n=1 Tax=Thalassovita sp. TaxID=1979401 RepID=UPI0029DE9074|nr:peptidoglycan-binding domain-containing protein [Thalassovita sp.]